jgi:hypothetical protein
MILFKSFLSLLPNFTDEKRKEEDGMIHLFIITVTLYYASFLIASNSPSAKSSLESLVTTVSISLIFKTHTHTRQTPESQTED